MTDQRQLEHARQLRRDMTPQERRLWFTFLRTYPVKIYKQRPIGPFIADFYCAQAGLVIELDGSQHYEDDGKQQDALRTAWLERQGLRVVRYSNADVNERFGAVCQEIDWLIRAGR